MTQAQNREEITNWESIPEFETEEEEQAFWDNHCLGDDILEQMQPVQHFPYKRLDKEGEQP
ncbi:hypothetical protein [Dactylococcopsis salina]|uniref:Uncharacterized protein n=1 Tax=Dactylococcopsis salina (strain PCC 8305) TaxID=13035 RepID=K9YTM6_DACS8|nr:hypothetical protein [Dactylococcopsis salina]AFZ49473.1 Protein of unknown function (DUF3680) [Dactylococcopsis salina PCC 8305]